MFKCYHGQISTVEHLFVFLCSILHNTKFLWIVSLFLVSSCLTVHCMADSCFDFPGMWLCSFSCHLWMSHKCLHQGISVPSNFFPLISLSPSVKGLLLEHLLNFLGEYVVDQLSKNVYSECTKVRKLIDVGSRSTQIFISLKDSKLENKRKENAVETLFFMFETLVLGSYGF